jgi:hypothetical protein
VALKAVGREGDAQSLASCAWKAMAGQSQGPVRSPEFPGNRIALVKAQVLALRGNGTGALNEMKQAVDLGYRNRLGSGLGALPALDPLRSAPQYAGLDQRLKRSAEIDREKVLKALNAS